MNLVKQTEQYRLEYTKNNLETSGTVFNNADGSLSINCVVKEGELNIGTFTYNQPKDSKVSVTFDVEASKKAIFATHVLEVIDNVLKNLSE